MSGHAGKAHATKRPAHPVARSSADNDAKVDNTIAAPTTVLVVFDKGPDGYGPEEELVLLEAGGKAQSHEASEATDITAHHGFVAFAPIKDKKTYSLVAKRGATQAPIFDGVPSHRLSWAFGTPPKEKSKTELEVLNIGSDQLRSHIPLLDQPLPDYEGVDADAAADEGRPRRPSLVVDEPRTKASGR